MPKLDNYAVIIYRNIFFDGQSDIKSKAQVAASNALQTFVTNV